MEFVIFALFMIVILGVLNRFHERFDGIGKSFSIYHHPKKCCKSKDCYPGMYLGNNFWQKNI